MGCCGMCGKCTKMSAYLLAVIGICFVARDLGYWDFFNLNWWSVLILYFGVMKLGAMSCKDCCKMNKK